MSPLPSPAAAAGTEVGAALPSVSFTVEARAEPGVMPRVVGLFAKRGLVPQACRSIATGPLLTIDVEMRGLDRDVCDYIARCMRQIVGVERVLMDETPPAG